MKTTNHLRKFKRINTSQGGEDGMIAEILKRLKINSGVVVDIGANDGKYYSNTFELLQRGFEVYGIEGKPSKVNDMFELKKEYPNLHPIHSMIVREKSSPNHINNILKRESVPTDIDVMSIDIDSIDAWVFEDLEVKPKLVVIEIGPYYYPLDMIWHNPDGDRTTNPPQNLTGFYPIYKIAKAKGYFLVGHSNLNSFYLRNDLIPTLNSPEFTDVPELSNFCPIRLSLENQKRWGEYEPN
jgi:hypothetical protein